MDRTTPEVPFHLWGEGVKSIRQLQGLSQSQLAQRVGVSQAAISRIEKGLQRPTDANRLKIASVLDVDPHRLFPLRSESSDVA